MRHDIRPKPSAEELEAIEEALARLTESAPDPRSPWWRAGVCDAVSEEEETD